MVEPTHQRRLIGAGVKPPKGAVVKSNGIERLGNDYDTNQPHLIQKQQGSFKIKITFF